MNLVWKKMKLQGTQTEKSSYSLILWFEEDITWYSNRVSPYKPGSLVWKKIKLHGTQTQGVFIIKKVLGLEEDKITWYSNVQRSRPQSRCGLEEDKIAWYSNPSLLRITR